MSQGKVYVPGDCEDASEGSSFVHSKVGRPRLQQDWHLGMSFSVARVPGEVSRLIKRR